MLTPTEIARELLAPTKVWHVVQIGDSRNAAKQKFVCTYTGLAWGGSSAVSMLPYDSTGHTSAWNALAGGVATENVYIPGDPANAIASVVYNTSVFTGAAEPSGAFSQLAYGAFPLDEYPLVKSRLIANGGGAKVKSIYRKHASSIAGGDGVRLELVEGTSSEVVLASATITDATGTGLAVAELAIPPGFDWLSRPNPYLRWRATPGGTNPENAIFQWADQPWIESTGPCLVHHTEAMSGGRWSWWVDTGFCPLSRWSDFHALYGVDRILWSSVGANSWGQTVEQNVSDLTEIISRFRVACPEGPVVLENQYPCQSTAGRVSTWREAIFQVAAVTPGVLVLDSYGLHDFEWWYSRGLMGDGVHASDPGVAQYMTDVGTMARFRGRT